MAFISIGDEPIALTETDPIVSRFALRSALIGSGGESAKRENGQNFNVATVVLIFMIFTSSNSLYWGLVSVTITKIPYTLNHAIN